MSTTTQCPHCGTRFKASQAQLEAYHGMVRCGNCQAAFDAIVHQCDEGPTPQLALPIADAELAPEPESITESEEIAVSGESTADEIDLSAHYPELREPRRWPLVMVNLLLLLLLLAQAVYLFRVQIAARLPGLKPVLLEACGVLHCDIPLPQDADMVNIESSDMQADPAHAEIITLTITIRNIAPYVQAYPKLELTLNDINDTPVARRTFGPSEYVVKDGNEESGMPSNREKTITLTVNTGNIKPAGYRLFLYY